jgi:hypothetical protein
VCTRPGYHALSPEQYDKCVRSVVVYFNGSDPDPAMRAAAAQLREDDRFESVREETRQQAYVKFEKTHRYHRPGLLSCSSVILPLYR